MKVRFHYGREVVCSSYFRSYAEGKLTKLEKMLFGVNKIDIALTREGNKYCVQICIQGDRVLRSEADSRSYVESFDKALTRISKQITKHKVLSFENRKQKQRMRGARRQMGLSNRRNSYHKKQLKISSL